MKSKKAASLETNNQNNDYPPEFYEIKVKGELDGLWTPWFEGMTLTHIENGETGLACTMISGLVTDQAALHGLLNKIRDLNLPLISVRRIMPGTNTAEVISVRLDSSGDQDENEVKQ